jgi:aspartyl aminopeptidase
MNAKELIQWIDASPTAFHAAEVLTSHLKEAGFEPLQMEMPWDLKPGGCYFVTKNDSAVIAFRVGNQSVAEAGFRLIGSHTDAPGFRIKPSAETISGKRYLRLNTEVYGGPIHHTWMDRPLTVAGRVMIASDDVMKPTQSLIHFKHPMAIIPNLAIHMNREVNQGAKFNPQTQLLPLVALTENGQATEDWLKKQVAAELKIEEDQILDWDLFLADAQPGCLIGENLISVGRQDNLSMVHASYQALTASKTIPATQVLVAYDNEEIGSRTMQGADSPWLSQVLERIAGKDRETYFRALAQSFLVSADMAHALHPNYPEKHDPTNQPVLGKGPVIKINASYAYTSNAASIAVFEGICKAQDIPVQRYVNRSDARGGSTIGPITMRHLPISAIDIGSPVLGMHSIRELGEIKDHEWMIQAMTAFFMV